MDSTAVSTAISSSEPEPSTSGRPDPPSILDLPFRLPNQNLISLGMLSPPSDADLESLMGSWLMAEDATRAAIRRVDSRQGQAILDRRGGNCAGLGYPNIMPGTDAIRQITVRLDRPLTRSQGPPAKYLSPRGSSNLLYIPPGTVVTTLSDISIPVAITEGAKKTLSLSRLSRLTSDQRLLPVGISGVWNWRGRRLDGDGTGPIADLDLVVWIRRKVYIIFDSDTADKPDVRRAREALATELSHRGAEVRLVDLPAIAAGEKSGVDDLLAHPDFGPGKVLELISSAKVFETKEFGAGTQAGNRRYEMTEQGTFRLIGSDAKDEKRLQFIQFHRRHHHRTSSKIMEPRSIPVNSRSRLGSKGRRKASP